MERGRGLSFVDMILTGEDLRKCRHVEDEELSVAKSEELCETDCWSPTSYLFKGTFVKKPRLTSLTTQINSLQTFG
jgi:hypothetical protein